MNSKNESLTRSDFVQSFEKLRARLSLPETEESWEKILNALEDLEKCCQAGVYDYTPELISSLRSVHRNITSAMSSERTRLSGAALDTITTLASSLNADFEPFVSLFLPGLIVLCGRTNKVVASRAKACILTIIDTTQLPSILTHLAHFVKDKSPTIRLVVAEGTLSCLKCFNPPDLEREVYSGCIENIVRVVVRDANSDIRRVGKDIFQSYKVLLPHRVDSFAAPLTPTIRKYLQLGVGNVITNSGRIAPTVSKAKSTSNRIDTSHPVKYGKNTGLGLPKTCPVDISNSDNARKPVGPLRSIQVPPPNKHKGDGAKAPDYRQLQPLTRPFPPTVTSTAGPQRVIKPLAQPTLIRTAPPNEKLKSAPLNGGGPVRPEKPPRRGISSDPVVHLPRSKPDAPVGQSLPRKKPTLKHSTTINSGRAPAARGDLTRPTVSQLARVKPVVARPTKPVERLGFQKAKASARVNTTKTKRLPGASNSQTEKVDSVSTDHARPNTPTSIPLPASPEPAVPPSTLPETNTPQDTQIKSIISPAPNDNLPNFQPKTPISALLSSIQQGFDLTPCSPLSPAQQYASSELDSPYESSLFQPQGITPSFARS